MDRPTIALALDDGPKKPPMAAMSDEADEGPEPQDDEAADPSLVEAAGAVKAAMESGDDEEFAKSLKGFIKLCGEY
jgi:hypothetical protein